MAATKIPSRFEPALSAYKMKANNTNTSADPTEQTFKDIAEQSIPDANITWTGTSAPSGTKNNTYQWTQIGKMVTVRFNLSYSIAGTALSNVLIELPSDLPTPVIPTGYNSAGNAFYMGAGSLHTAQTLTTTFAVAGLKYTGSIYQVQIAKASAAYQYAFATITYWIA